MGCGVPVKVTAHSSPEPSRPPPCLPPTFLRAARIWPPAGEITKKEQGINIPRLGYHGEKRAGIRDPKFRRLDPAVQEELAGTTWETMRRVYDFVDLPTLQNAVALLETDSDEPTPTVPQMGPRRGLKKAA